MILCYQNNIEKKVGQTALAAPPNCFPEASAWGVFVRRFRPEEFSSGRNLQNLLPKTPHFPERGGEGVGRGGRAKGGGGRVVNGPKSQAEICGRKLLGPKPLESVPQFFCPSHPPHPSPSNKAGWAHRSKLLRDNNIKMSKIKHTKSKPIKSCLASRKWDRKNYKNYQKSQALRV